MMAALLYLITLFSLSAIMVTLSESISIDCGSTGSYVGSNNVTWVEDKGFVTTGETMKIPDVVTKPMNSLRYFPTGQTNCYSNIPVTKGQKTLVRTRFKYENYDGKFSPPSFDLIYDRKHRDSIEITESLLNDEENFYFSEVIFAPANENISVCLIRTSPSYDPFISSIEVYGMDAGMYKDLGPNEGLLLQKRMAYGAKEIISYPIDPYGRLWSASGSQDNPTLTELSTSAPSIDITGASNKPPEIVMSKAVSEDGLKITYEALPLTGITVYLVLYFSEPQSLGRNQRRSFNVSLDTSQVGSHPIVPLFGKATQFVLRDVVATSMSQIIFQSTDDSDLPPLINGLELYSISNSNRDTQGPGATEPHKNNAVEEPLDVMKTKGRKKKKNKLPLILGVTFASAFAILSSGFGAIFLRKRQNAKPHSNTTPTTSTGHGTGTGMSPLVEQQFASDTNDSYVVQDEHH